MAPIYLDYNATTSLDSAVLAALDHSLREEFGNSFSPHNDGTTCAGTQISYNAHG